jgi:hypothetical protein
MKASIAVVTYKTVPKGAILMGTGWLTWTRGERISDRYGAVHLCDDNWEKGKTIPLDTADQGLKGFGRLVAEVIETRDSTHIGDLFRSIHPVTPEVGEIIHLGEGTLFTKAEDGVKSVGLEPRIPRDADWLNPYALYRCHEQTVRLYFVPGKAGGL